MRSIRNLLLLALVSLALAGCSKSSKTTLSSALQNDLAMLPQNVQSVFYADVQSLQNSELGKEFRKTLDSTMEKHEHDADYKEFVEATGFDPKKDLQSMLVGMEAELDESEESSEHMEGAMFAIIKGSFDESKIIAHIQTKETEEGKHELVVETYNGKTLYSGPREKFAAYFADAKTLFAGKKDWVKMVIDQKMQGQNLTSNSSMMALIDALPHKDQLWAVGTPGKLMEQVASELGKHENFKGGHALRSLQSGMVSAQVNAEANIWATAKCTTEEDSRLMADAVKGALAMAKLAVSDDRDLVDMLNRFEIEAKGSEVHFTGKIDKAFIEKMKEKRTAKRMAAL